MPEAENIPDLELPTTKPYYNDVQDSEAFKISPRQNSLDSDTPESMSPSIPSVVGIVKVILKSDEGIGSSSIEEKDSDTLNMLYVQRMR